MKVRDVHLPAERFRGPGGMDAAACSGHLTWLDTAAEAAATAGREIVIRAARP